MPLKPNTDCDFCGRPLRVGDAVAVSPHGSLMLEGTVESLGAKKTRIRYRCYASTRYRGNPAYDATANFVAGSFKPESIVKL